MRSWLKNLALFALAPWFGLAYLVLFPPVALVMLGRLALQAAHKRAPRLHA